MTERRSISEAQQKIVDANLVSAVSQNDREKIDLCLQKGADINARWENWDNRTALMVAVGYSRDELVAFILTKGPDLFLTDKNNKTVFDVADELSDGAIKKKINRLLLAALPDAGAPVPEDKITVGDDIPILKPIELDRHKKGGGSFQL